MTDSDTPKEALSIEIRYLTDGSIWEAFVDEHPDSTCFHKFAWKQALEIGLGYETCFLAAFSGEVCIGIFSFALVKSKLFGNSVVSLPFCTYGGPLVTVEEAHKALHEEAERYSRKNMVNYLESRIVSKFAAAKDFEGTYFSFKKPIPPGPAALTFLPSKRRNMVRKAISAGLTFEVKTDLNTFFRLYSANAKAHGTPALSKKFFKNLIDVMGSNLDILFVNDSGGNAISCIMSFYHKGSVHAGFAGELPSARSYAANDFKYWSLYQHAIERGCTEFDLGRSKSGTGSFEFKKLWGLDCYPITHDYTLILATQPPQNNPNNPKFALAIKVWSRLPSQFTNWLGPKIIHGLG